MAMKDNCDSTIETFQTPESQITTKNYWDEFYKNELKLFQSNKINGDEWFESETKSIVEWIHSFNVDSCKAKILDIGCGNGLFLVRLLRKGYKNLFGCDYVPAAIALAKLIVSNVLRRLLNGENNSEDETDDDENNDEKQNGAGNSNLDFRDSNVTLVIWDFTATPNQLQSSSVSSGFLNSDSEMIVNVRQNQLYDGDNDMPFNVVIDSPINLPKFDLIHDKGTFDLFFMNNRTSLYIRSICNIINNQCIICITSCNASETELIQTFTKYEAPNNENIIKFICISTLQHSSFTFAGLKGQSVSTAAFKAIIY